MSYTIYTMLNHERNRLDTIHKISFDLHEPNRRKPKKEKKKRNETNDKHHIQNVIGCTRCQNKNKIQRCRCQRGKKTFFAEDTNRRVFGGGIRCSSLIYLFLKKKKKKKEKREKNLRQRHWQTRFWRQYLPVLIV